MDFTGGFIMQKTVDWSLLNDGMTIPVSACALLKAWDESILTHGVGKDIKVLIDSKLFDAKLKNQNFAQSNWAGHKDVIQIRYGLPNFQIPNSENQRVRDFYLPKNPFLCQRCVNFSPVKWYFMEQNSSTKSRFSIPPFSVDTGGGLRLTR